MPVDEFRDKSVVATTANRFSAAEMLAVAPPLPV
jgi:hypothetical protein